MTLEVSDGDKSATLDVSVTVLDAVEGRVVDAPLSGSSVFIDLDGDSVQDDDEPSVSSDEKGFFVVERLDAKEGFSRQNISTGGTPKASKQIAQVKKGEATGAIANG